jgi:hypothetical protein
LSPANEDSEKKSCGDGEPTPGKGPDTYWQRLRDPQFGTPEEIFAK